METDIQTDIANLAKQVGLHIVPGDRPFVYGSLDSIAILVDLLLSDRAQDFSLNTHKVVDKDQVTV